MIEPIEFTALLEKSDIRFVTGVPDSLLKDVCACMAERFGPKRHIVAANEGSATALAIGHYLATGRPALVYMQNSGLGNAMNPVTSLADPHVCGIPMILMIGWRGEILEDGKQLRDEPQHVKQGQITTKQLEILDIPYRIIGNDSIDIGRTLGELVGLATSRPGPAALIVRNRTFAPFKLMNSGCDKNQLAREAAIAAVISALPDNLPIVSTTGMASRELYELRVSFGKGHHGDFLVVGGMGHAGQIASGIAMARPDHRVVCIDGDGAMLMHMGSLAISADCPNLLHILINNGAHDSVGGQPTKGDTIDFMKIAKACGYGRVSLAVTADEILANVRSMLEQGLSSFLEIKCRRGFRVNLGRPDRSPAQNKIDFMRFLPKDR